MLRARRCRQWRCWSREPRRKHLSQIENNAAGPFASARGQLAELHLDPEQDKATGPRPALDSYLAYYAIDLEREFSGLFRGSGMVRVGDFHIATHYWLPESCQGTVIVLHGYFDHVGLYGKLFRYLLQRNLAVVAPDLPGHGLSSGARASIASFDLYVDVLDLLLEKVKAGLPGPISAVGQSTGAAVLLKRVLELGYGDFDRVVTLAPLVQPAYWRVNRLIFHSTHRFRRSIPRKFRVNSADRTFLHFLKHQDPLQDLSIPMDWLRAMKRWIDECKAAPVSDCPLVIIQGERDTTLDWEYNLRLLAKKFPRARIHRIANAGHHLSNEVAEVRNRVFGAMGFKSG